MHVEYKVFERVSCFHSFFISCSIVEVYKRYYKKNIDEKICYIYTYYVFIIYILHVRKTLSKENITHSYIYLKYFKPTFFFLIFLFFLKLDIAFILQC